MRPFPTSNSVPPPRYPHLRNQNQNQARETEMTIDSSTETEAETETETETDGRRNRTQFYLPSPGANTEATLSRTTSRHHDPGHSGHSRRPSALSLSVPGTPSHLSTSRSSSRAHLHRRSRTSIAGLRNALQTYRIPSEHEHDLETGSDTEISPASASRHLIGQGSELSFGPGYSRGGRLLDYGGREREREDLDIPIGGLGFNRHALPGQETSREMLRSPLGLGQEMMDALVEIHRVLYRGREDMKWSDGQLRWDEQGQEVKRVVERWFEGDCSMSPSQIMFPSQSPSPSL